MARRGKSISCARAGGGSITMRGRDRASWGICGRSGSRTPGRFCSSIIGTRQAEPEQLVADVLAVHHDAGEDPEVFIPAEVLQVDPSGTRQSLVHQLTGGGLLIYFQCQGRPDLSIDLARVVIAKRNPRRTTTEFVGC